MMPFVLIQLGLGHFLTSPKCHKQLEGVHNHGLLKSLMNIFSSIELTSIYISIIA